MNASFEEILAFAMGDADDATAARVTAAVAANAKLADEVSRARALVAALRSDRTPEPPAAWLSAAKSVFKAAPKQAGWLASAIAKLGTVVYDSRAQVALAGFRGADDGVRMSFVADDVEVDLQFHPEQAAGHRVLGQISDPHSTSAEIALLDTDSGDVIDLQDSDASGVFRLAATPGTYDMLVRVGGRLIKLEKIAIP
jgi:anti-sigma factor ChrR (cupin superfamily)